MISKVEELTEEVMKNEILHLLRAEAKILHKQGSKLLEEFVFNFSDHELMLGPVGRQMKMIFEHVKKEKEYDPIEIHKYCFQIVEFLWPSQFRPHFSIPDAFWDTPMGFVIYEVVGKIENAPSNKELSSVQSAKYIGMTLPAFQKLVEEGTLKIIREEGGKPRYLVKDLEELKKTL